MLLPSSLCANPHSSKTVAKLYRLECLQASLWSFSFRSKVADLFCFIFELNPPPTGYSAFLHGGHSSHPSFFGDNVFDKHNKPACNQPGGQRLLNLPVLLVARTFARLPAWLASPIASPSTDPHVCLDDPSTKWRPFSSRSLCKH